MNLEKLCEQYERRRRFYEERLYELRCEYAPEIYEFLSKKRQDNALHVLRCISRLKKQCTMGLLRRHSPKVPYPTMFDIVGRLTAIGLVQDRVGRQKTRIYTLSDLGAMVLTYDLKHISSKKKKRKYEWKVIDPDIDQDITDGLGLWAIAKKRGLPYSTLFAHMRFRSRHAPEDIPPPEVESRLASAQN